MRDALFFSPAVPYTGGLSIACSLRQIHTHNSGGRERHEVRRRKRRRGREKRGEGGGERREEEEEEEERVDEGEREEEGEGGRRMRRFITDDSEVKDVSRHTQSGSFRIRGAEDRSGVQIRH